jgi:hypothetical protein
VIEVLGAVQMSRPASGLLASAGDIARVTPTTQYPSFGNLRTWQRPSSNIRNCLKRSREWKALVYGTYAVSK